MEQIRVDGRPIVIKMGDITEEVADAIVNAANSSLMVGGGVDGAIHRAGGPDILAECRAVREARGLLPAGEAVSTTAGGLRARRVIHTVGPIWRGGVQGEEATLQRAYRSSLAVAAEEGLRTVAFPSISTGAYGYPVRQASVAALCSVASFVDEGPEILEEVRFVLFDETTFDAYRHAARFVSRFTTQT